MRTIHVLRKPCSEGTVAANVLKWGTGAINVDGCRIGYEAGGSSATNPTVRLARGCRIMCGNDADPSAFRLKDEAQPMNINPSGRWPANVLHDGSEGVVSTFPDTGTSTGGRIGNASGAYANQGRTGWGMGHEAGDPGFGDAGSASRYFQVVHMTKADR